MWNHQRNAKDKILRNERIKPAKLPAAINGTTNRVYYYRLPGIGTLVVNHYVYVKNTNKKNAGSIVINCSIYINKKLFL